MSLYSSSSHKWRYHANSMPLKLPGRRTLPGEILRFPDRCQWLLRDLSSMLSSLLKYRCSWKSWHQKRFLGILHPDVKVGLDSRFLKGGRGEFEKSHALKSKSFKREKERLRQALTMSAFCLGQQSRWTVSLVVPIEAILTAMVDAWHSYGIVGREGTSRCSEVVTFKGNTATHYYI